MTILSNKFTKWTLPAGSSLRLDRAATLKSLEDDEVLVELFAASLNYRDLMIAQGKVPGDVKDGVVPGSDGAGIVRAAGKNVTGFKEGERVVTHLAPTIAADALPTMPDISAGLGQNIDGTLREFGTFGEAALVKAPKNLSFEQAATLTCSGLTAWNAVFGLRGRAVKQDDWVLVQGTGGVSIAVLQFAVAAGAHVVATTSSDEKAKRLKDLGAEQVINYRQTPAWGEKAKQLTTGQRGFDLVVDVGGDSTLAESVMAIRTDGIVAGTGILGTSERPFPAMAALYNVCTIRGILMGTKEQFVEMVRFIEEKGVEPALDEVVFRLEDAEKAYQRLEAQKHFSKVVIQIKA